jgi:hypothetical protein
MRSRLARSLTAGVLVLAAALLATACSRGGSADAITAGDIPDSQVFVPYSPSTGGFTVSVPEGWARTDAAGAVTFTDKFNSVRIETVPAATAPTVQSAERDEVPALRAQATNFQLGKVSMVTRTGGSAVLVTYQVDGPPDPVTGKVARLDVERYEFWKDGRQATLTLSGAVGSDNVDPWKTISDSFRWA